MKRRVSVAISLVSDPKLIFFDEPSTGLDPENRRQLWDILSKFKGKKSMVLTTHSMEEADVLCNRISIVNNGILRCIAPSARLKNLYGGGYHLTINLKRQHYFSLKSKLEKRKQQNEKKNKNDIKEHPQQVQKTEDTSLKLQKEATADMFNQLKQGVLDFVYLHLPNADLIRETNGCFIFLIPLTNEMSASQIYILFETHKEDLFIQDWGMSQSSLEDVFTKICEQNGDNNS